MTYNLLAHLPEDPLSVALSYLPIKELAETRKTCKDFNKAAIKTTKQRLPAYFKNMEGSLLGKISNKYPNMSAEQIIAIADRLLKGARPIIEELDQALSGPIEALTYQEKNRLAEIASNRRAEILYKFFERLCNIDDNPDSREKVFLDEIKNHDPRQRAQEIRAWMNEEENQPFLQEITTLGIEFENLIREEELKEWILPPEVLKLQNLTQEQLGFVFMLQSYNGNLETFAKILSERNDAITELDLGWALCAAAARGHQEVVNALIQSDRFNEIIALDLGWALRDAAINGHLEVVNALLQSDRSNEIIALVLGGALCAAARKGHLEIVNALIQSGRFDAIPANNLGWALFDAAKEGHLEIVNALLQSDRSNEISAEHLGWALRDVAKKGHLAIVNALLQSDRGNEIRPEDLGLALYNTATNDHLEIVNALLQSDRSNEISAEHLGWALRNAAKNGHSEVVNALIQSDRFDAITALDLGLALCAAAEEGHLEIAEALVFEIPKALPLIGHPIRSMLEVFQAMYPLDLHEEN
ncbi:MAG: hypothetical protein COT85_02010 [Chlamydiae bacterium CG10_big_fil_rev_8_21_14_0_10_42_34]|nr:MAG: hypothetical protein COT85_02010 [Chlamydiae bacterium CG10_big_fil_rev_8_21_14_0_10_42_34]